MATQNRRSSFSSSTSSSLAKRSSENMGKAIASSKAAPHLAKKRQPLSNLTNRKNVGSQINGKNSSSSVTLVPCSTKTSNAKQGSYSSTRTKTIPKNALLPYSTSASRVVLPRANSSLRKSGVSVSTSTTILPVPCSIHVSPTRSDGCSVSMDESTSTCDSFNSPEVHYMDCEDVSVDTLDRKSFSSLSLSENSHIPGDICKRNAIMDIDIEGAIVNVDDNIMDPQLCATIACDIYKHLRASEAKKRPSTDYMERIQRDINASMRAILVDWLVEVSEEYRLVPETLYFTVNYIDRYLSGNAMNRQRLQLLGIACMMIASKYEEICAPQVEEFCYITDNTYFKEEVLQMESAVLNYLKFEMTGPTPKCFLRRFVRAAQGMNEIPLMQLECMANYIAELSLLEYNMLPYAPSLIAASSIFLANYILSPSKKPWNSTLTHYSRYQPSDIHECVMELHKLCCNSKTSSLPAIREKYSQHKYKFVAMKHCPLSIPPQFFENVNR